MFQWSLVCDRAYLVSLLQTTYMAGWLVGCVLYGQVADRYGRKKAMMTALVVQFVVCMAQVSAILQLKQIKAFFLLENFKLIGQTSTNNPTYWLLPN